MMDRRNFLKGAAAAGTVVSVSPLLPKWSFAANTPVPAGLVELPDPRQRPYVTALTPEMIADNNDGWVYYGAECNASFGPNLVNAKSQMTDDMFVKNPFMVRGSCYYPNTGEIGHGIHWETFSFIEWMLEGRFKFERFYGQVLHTLADGWTALRSGLMDFTQIYHQHNQGAFQLSMADGLPFLFNSQVVSSQVMMEMYPKYFKPELEKQGMYCAFIPHFDVQSIICTTPIRRMEDLRGKRIMGFGGEVLRDTLIGLGATPVQLPTPDIFIGLQRGVIDGVAWAVGGIIDWRYHEIAKYTTITGMAQARIDYGWNRPFWDRIPKPFAEEIYYWMQVAGNHCAEGYTKLEDRGVEQLEAVGIEIIHLPDEEKKRWNEVGDRVWQQWIARHEANGLPARQFAIDFRTAAGKYNDMSIREIRNYVLDKKNLIRGIIDGF